MTSGTSSHLYRRLAGAVQASSKQGNLVNPLHIMGTVAAVSLTASGEPTATVTLLGDPTQISGVKFKDSYTPVPGDVVVIVRQSPGMWWIDGKICNTAGSNGSNGWTAPTLTSGVTANASDPPLYRAIVDHGTVKVQLKGTVNVSGSPATLWTFPGGAGSICTPSTNRQIAVVTSGGIQSLVVNTSGQVFLFSGQSGISIVIFHGYEYFVN